MAKTPHPYAADTPPRYRITLTIERDDYPGAEFRAIFNEVPKGTAEDPNYIHFSAVETFRQFIICETRPDPREG